MPYVGRGLDRGNYLKLDNISSSFNNTLTTFNLTAGNQAFFPGSAFSILVVLAGVVQEPEAAYSINQSQIIFASAPLAGDQFFCISLGVPLGINVPGNGTVDGAQLARPFNYDGYFYLDDANNRVGVGTATPQKPLHVIGEGQFDSVRILGDLTIDGTTTTLDTVVTEVDKLEVGANNSTVGVAITQSGSGDILNLYDGSTEVFSVADGGDVSIVDKIIHTGDTNTAIRFPADDTVTVETAGTERFRVTSAGNVGIGTADPQRKLSIKDSGNTFISIENLSNVTSGLIGANSSGLTLISRDTQGGSTAKPIQFITGSTEKVRISSTGLVGIGTADPQSQFEVFGSSPIVRSKHSTSQKYTQINHNGTDGYVDWSSGGLILRGASNAERLRITDNGSTIIGGTTPATVGQTQLTLRSNGQVGLSLLCGANQNSTIYMGGVADGYSSGASGYSDGKIMYDNSNNHMQFNTAGTERLRIDSDGYARLTTANARLEWKASSGSNPFIRSIGSDQQELEFNTGGTERLRITSAGLVGIGTDNPSDELSVVSSLTTDSVLRLQGGTSAGKGSGIRLMKGASAVGYIGPESWLFGSANTSNTLVISQNAQANLSITSAGLVGIGLTNPQTELHVKGLDGYAELRLEGISTGGGTIEFYNQTTKVADIYADNTNNIVFRNTTERLRITSAGHMGLGKTPADTNSFTRALDISGTSGSALYARTNSSGSDFAVFGYYGQNLFVRENSGSGELRFQGGSVNRLVIKSTGIIDASMNTTAVALPTGTTAQRPSGTDAYIRKNSTNNALEFYNGTNWVEIITDYFPTGSTTLG
jgi:hypothetical protein